MPARRSASARVRQRQGSGRQGQAAGDCSAVAATLTGDPGPAFSIADLASTTRPRLDLRRSPDGLGTRDHPVGSKQLFRRQFLSTLNVPLWTSRCSYCLARAGVPTMSVSAGTSLRTPAPSPTRARAPTVRPGPMQAPVPTKTSSPQRTLPASRAPGLTCTPLASSQSWSTEAVVFTTQWALRRARCHDRPGADNSAGAEKGVGRNDGRRMGQDSEISPASRGAAA